MNLILDKSNFRLDMDYLAENLTCLSLSLSRSNFPSLFLSRSKRLIAPYLPFITFPKKQKPTYDNR